MLPRWFAAFTLPLKVVGARRSKGATRLIDGSLLTTLRTLGTAVIKNTLLTVLLVVTGGSAAAEEIINGTARVRDGDTIVVAGVPVRLNGLDAPETNTRAGQEAKNALTEYLRGKSVTCKLNGERTYDRMVGTCYVGQSDIAASLVAAGLALDCARYSGGRYRRFEPEGIRQRLPQAGYC